MPSGDQAGSVALTATPRVSGTIRLRPVLSTFSVMIVPPNPNASGPFWPGNVARVAGAAAASAATSATLTHSASTTRRTGRF